MPTYSGTTVPGGVTFSESTVSPNDTVYVDSVRAVGATGYLDLALVPARDGFPAERPAWPGVKLQEDAQCHGVPSLVRVKVKWAVPSPPSPLGLLRAT